MDSLIFIFFFYYLFLVSICFYVCFIIVNMVLCLIILEYALVILMTLVVSFLMQTVLLKKLGKNLSEEFDGFIENIINPQTKRAFSHIASMGGNTKAVNAIKGKLAKGFIDQNYGMLKIVAEKLGGVDVDELIDEYGADNILTAIQDFAPRLGLNLGKGLKGLNIGSNISSSVSYPPEE